MSEDHNAPNILAYRVGQLEKKQEAGFTRLEEKIDKYADGFVTQAQMIVAQQRADEAHERISKDIKTARDEFKVADKNQSLRIQGLEDWNTWAVRTVIGFVVIGVLTAAGVAAV